MAWFSASETNTLLKQIKTTLPDCLDLVHLLVTHSLPDTTGGNQLLAKINKTIYDHLYYLPVEKLKEIDQLLTDTENKKLVQKKEKTLERGKKLPLAKRAQEIMAKIDGIGSHEWLNVILSPGILDHENNQKLVEFMNQQMIEFLASLDESHLQETLINLTYYKQTAEAKHAKTKDLNQMKKQGAVKTNISHYQNLLVHQPTKRNTIIQRKAVIVPDSFIKKIGSIHCQKTEELEVASRPSKGNMIQVRETHQNGSLHLRGQKTNGQRTGIWKWYDEKGDQYAECNYSESDKWFYIVTTNKTRYTKQNIGSDPDFHGWARENHISTCDVQGWSWSESYNQ